ncbi:Ankyrin repeat domain-containing protein 26 [Podochytrium sp. JEL0797]|nr:Ankyrin repeat domain-containing protein 26 [Podochytrium sp. JEL0797]
MEYIIPTTSRPATRGGGGTLTGVNYIPPTARRLLQSRDGTTTHNASHSRLNTPAAVKPTTPHSNPLFPSTHHAPDLTTNPFPRVPTVVNFPVLRAVEADRGVGNHNPREVSRDPFVKSQLVGESGFLSHQIRVLETLLGTGPPTAGVNRESTRALYDSLFREFRATRRDVCVDVERLVTQVVELMRANGVDVETGRPPKVGEWVENRGLNRLQGEEEREAYLHWMFQEVARGCFERKVWKEEGGGSRRRVGGKGMKGDEEEEAVEFVQSFALDITRLKSEKSRLIASLQPPKPIPPQDVRSLGSKIRRKQQAVLRGPKIANPMIQLLVKNERHGEGATVKEVQRVAKVLKYELKQARIAKDVLDHRSMSNLVAPDSKSFADWVREKEGKRLQLLNEPPEPKFSVRQFINQYLLNQKTGHAAAKLEPPALGVTSSRLNTPVSPPAASEMLSSKIPGPMLWALCHDPIAQILQKTAWERTLDEVEVLVRVVRDFSAFMRLSEYVVREVCGSSLVWKEFGAGETVICQNDIANAWYIILSGTVNVKKSRTSNLSDSVHIASLHPGQGFGDAGLLNSTIRTASVVTAEPCEMVVVNKADYNRVIKDSHSRLQNEVAGFLKSLHVFGGWERNAVLAIAKGMWVQELKPGKILISEGDLCKEIYFIKQGAVAMYKNVTYKGKQISVKVALLGHRAILCPEAVLLKGKYPILRTRKTSTDPIPFHQHNSHPIKPVTTSTNSTNVYSRFTIRAAGQHDTLLLEAAHNIRLADHRQRASAERDGMVMDFRTIRDFNRFETQDWVYEDLIDLVATREEDEMKRVRRQVVQDERFNPALRPSMRDAAVPVHRSETVGGVVLVCAEAADVRIGVGSVEAVVGLLGMTEEECVGIQEAKMERGKWRKMKKESMQGMKKEVKVDCQAEYGTVIGEKQKVTTELWRR